MKKIVFVFLSFACVSLGLFSAEVAVEGGSAKRILTFKEFLAKKGEIWGAAEAMASSEEWNEPTAARVVSWCFKASRSMTLEQREIFKAEVLSKIGAAEDSRLMVMWSRAAAAVDHGKWSARFKHEKDRALSDWAVYYREQKQELIRTFFDALEKNDQAVAFLTLGIVSMFHDFVTTVVPGLGGIVVDEGGKTYATDSKLAEDLLLRKCSEAFGVDVKIYWEVIDNMLKEASQLVSLELRKEVPLIVSCDLNRKCFFWGQTLNEKMSEKLHDEFLVNFDKEPSDIGKGMWFRAARAISSGVAVRKKKQ
jgi:hypothetical protein